MEISRLVQISPPPQNPVETGSIKAWERIEERLGVALPEDYKEFIDLYGSGKFENSIVPFNPFAASEYLNLLQSLDIHHQSNRFAQGLTSSPWSAVSPFDLYPALDGLLPWGTMGNFKEGFFWQVCGPPDQWPTIYYDLKNGEYEVWKFQFSEFLVKLFLGEIQSVLMPAAQTYHDRQIQFLPELQTSG